LPGEPLPGDDPVPGERLVPDAVGEHNGEALAAGEAFSDGDAHGGEVVAVAVEPVADGDGVGVRLGVGVAVVGEVPLCGAEGEARAIMVPPIWGYPAVPIWPTADRNVMTADR
jgi:hypothetical protein